MLLENKVSFEILFEDGYRLGAVTLGGRTVKTPSLIENVQDYLILGDIKIEKPISYLVEDNYSEKNLIFLLFH